MKKQNNKSIDALLKIKLNMFINQLDKIMKEYFFFE